MPYDIIIGRDNEDKLKYGNKGLINIGRSYVKMGQTTSLANNIMLDVAKTHVILVSGKRGSGKCLHGDTLITFANGMTKKIEELEEYKEDILALDENLKIVSTAKTEFFKRETDKLIKLRLRSGKELKLTPEHPLLTIKGWKPIQDLVIGARIATPRTISIMGKDFLPDHEIKLLAYLIAEGHLSNNFVLFSNCDETIKQEFFKCIKLFDKNLRIDEHSKPGCYRVSQKIKLFDILNTIDKRKHHSRLIRYKKSSIRAWLEKFNLYNKLSREKFIPDKIFTLNNSRVALFLNRLFSCDGSIYKHKTTHGYSWEISYSSMSKTLIKQVQHLLLRFSIHSRIRLKKIKINKKELRCFELEIGPADLITFIKQIGFFGIKEKKQKIAITETVLITRNPNVDTIPKDIWELYRPKNWADIGRVFGYAYPKAMRERLRYCPSRQTLLQISKADNNKAIELIATSDIFWDEIVSIELLKGNFEVYDICVPQLHNFIANDIIVHNSYSLSVMVEGISSMSDDVKKNVAIIIFDTMGIFWTMKFPNKREEKLLAEWNMKPEAMDVDLYTPIGYYEEYRKKGIPSDYAFTIKTTELSAGEWCDVFEINLTEPAGVLIERIVTDLKESGQEYGIKDIIRKIRDDVKTDKQVKDAAENRFAATESWGLFSEKGVGIDDILKPGRTSIIDVSCYTSASGAWSIKNLVIGIICKKLLESRIVSRKYEELVGIETEGRYFTDEKKMEKPMVWLVIDEAHSALPKMGATPASNVLIQLLREGRQPGISMVLATQQPGEIHKDVLTQSDIVISHRLTAKPDINALNKMMQSYLLDDIQKYMNDLPRLSGSAIILDDNSERIYPMRVHPKKSWHGGETPSAIKVKKELELD